MTGGERLKTDEKKENRTNSRQPKTTKRASGGFAQPSLQKRTVAGSEQIGRFRPLFFFFFFWHVLTNTGRDW